ncbi:unnamed protein product [Cuscuta campestris]|uniref:Late embryogenesis abundant protein LEA-2 subgroup domain-containing protein n=1 Tax=Cuscuta campestris TaxID=132261 RepID=A0A484LS70_9ASTE|nr:unnamed protein product [Cuscuta campestris]
MIELSNMHPHQQPPNTAAGGRMIHRYERRQQFNLGLIRQFCGALFTSIVIFTLIGLIAWAVLQPLPPSFVLEHTTLSSYNLSIPDLIFSPTLQVRIWYHNPNRRIEIYYDKLKVYAAYYDRQVTQSADIPPIYQGDNDTNVLSPTLLGNNSILSYYVVPNLLRDQDDGAFWIAVKIDGRVMFRVGDFVSEPFHLHVSCPAHIPFFPNSSRGSGFVVGPKAAAKYPLSRTCAVSVPTIIRRILQIIKE